MGTRHLTAVVHNGSYRIAQYGQWDGYPDGQGATVLSFLSEPGNIEKLQAGLAHIVEPTEDDLRRLWAEVGHDIDASGGWVDMRKSQAFGAKNPALDRDTGAKILRLVAEATGPIFVKSSLNFAGDSLFCEWAWVVDLDRRTFEAFEGVNKVALALGERFAFLDTPDGTDGGYHPVKFVRSWGLDALPTEEDFLASFKVDEEV